MCTFQNVTCLKFNKRTWENDSALFLSSLFNLFISAFRFCLFLCITPISLSLSFKLFLSLFQPLSLSLFLPFLNWTLKVGRIEVFKGQQNRIETIWQLQPVKSTQKKTTKKKKLFYLFFTKMTVSEKPHNFASQFYLINQQFQWTCCSPPKKIFSNFWMLLLRNLLLCNTTHDNTHHHNSKRRLSQFALISRDRKRFPGRSRPQHNNVWN